MCPAHLHGAPGHKSVQGSLSPTVGVSLAHWPPRSNTTPRKPSLTSRLGIYNLDTPSCHGIWRMARK